MKKEYINPEIEIIVFETEDVLLDKSMGMAGDDKAGYNDLFGNQD